MEMAGRAMRTAAKAAALGTTGFRSVGPFAGRAALVAGRRAHIPESATVSPGASTAAEGGSSISISSPEKGHQEAISASSVQRPSWETNDWQLTGWAEPEAAVALDSQRPVPRLVFGSVPTLEEAKEATSDLKSALDAMYFSPSNDNSAILVSHELIGHDTLAVCPSLPKNVAQTFTLLRENRKVQDAVASLVADQNVWEAVMKNEKVLEFYNTHRSIVHPPESGLVSEAPAADCSSESFTSSEETKTSPFADIVHKVKVKVVEVVSDIFNFVHDFFETFAGASSSTNMKSSNDKQSVDFAVGASLMTLAVTVMMVILFKRI